MKKKFNVNNLIMAQLWKCRSIPNYYAPLLTDVIGRPIEYLVVNKQDSEYIDILTNKAYKEVGDYHNGYGINTDTIIPLSSVVKEEKISLKEAKIIKDLYNSEIFIYTQRIKELYGLLYETSTLLSEEQIKKLIDKLNICVGEEKTTEIIKLLTIILDKGKNIAEKNKDKIFERRRR